MCVWPHAGLCPPPGDLAAGVHSLRGPEAETEAQEAGADRDQGGGGHSPPASTGAPGQVY